MSWWIEIESPDMKIKAEEIEWLYDTYPRWFRLNDMKLIVNLDRLITWYHNTNLGDHFKSVKKNMQEDLQLKAKGKLWTP